MEEQIVYIVTTECNYMSGGLPIDEEHGNKIRLVTTSTDKAFKCFDEWRRRIDGYMTSHGMVATYHDNYEEGDTHYWSLWNGNGDSRRTNVQITRHEVTN